MTIRLYDQHSTSFDFNPGASLPFADIAELAAFDDRQISDGGLAYTSTVRSLWIKRVVSPVPTTDGITIVATASGDGAWYRSTAPSLSWQSQATWYIDPAAGDDENDGSTTAAGGSPAYVGALATWAEFYRRSGGLLSVATTVYLLGDSTEVFAGSFTTVSTVVSLTIQGVPTTTSLGAVNACTFTNASAAANARGTLTSTTADYTPYVGMLLRATGDYVAPLLTSFPYVSFWTRATFSNSAPPNTAALEALTLPKLPSAQIEANGIDCYINYLEFTGTAVNNAASINTTSLGAAIFFACIFKGYITTFASAYFLGCLLQAGGSTTGLNILAGTATFIGGGSLRSISFAQRPGLLALQSFIIQGGSLTVGGSAYDAVSSVGIPTSLGIFDSGGVGLTARAGANIYGVAVFGSGHTTGISATGGAQIRFGGTPTITTNAGTNQVVISKAPGLAGANDVIPIRNGIPAGPAVSMTTWATWAGADINEYAVNLADGTRICST